MADSNITPNTLAGASANDVVASDGKGAVGSVPAEALSLEQLNTFLGKDFKDKDTALKSIKETFTFLGKRKEDYEAEFRAKLQPSQNNTVDNKAVERLETIERNLWFAENAQYKAVRPLIEKLAGNGSLDEAVNSQEFKEVFSKAQGYDETQKSKTVLQSNPKVKTTTNKLTSALQASNSGKYEQSAQDATSAVMEMYGL